MGMYPLFDPLYLVIIIPTVLLSIWAQARVKGAYNRWSKVQNRRACAVQMQPEICSIAKAS